MSKSQQGSSDAAKGRSDAAKGIYQPPNKGFFGGLKLGATENEKKRFHQYNEGHADKKREMKKKE